MTLQRSAVSDEEREVTVRTATARPIVAPQRANAVSVQTCYRWHRTSVTGSRASSRQRRFYFNEQNSSSWHIGPPTYLGSIWRHCDRQIRNNASQWGRIGKAIR